MKTLVFSLLVLHTNTFLSHHMIYQAIFVTLQNPTLWAKKHNSYLVQGNLKYALQICKGTQNCNTQMNQI